MITVKPIKGKRTTIGQAFDEAMSDFPILAWSLKNEKKR